MSFVEPFDRRHVANDAIQTIRSRFFAQNELLKYLEQCEHLSEFRCFLVYDPKLFTVDPPMEPIDEEIDPNKDEEQERIRIASAKHVRELMQYVFYKSKEVEIKELLPRVDEFFQNFDASFRIQRAFDYLYFATAKEQIDPVVFKLSTGLHVCELTEVSLRQCVEQIRNAELS